MPCIQMSGPSVRADLELYGPGRSSAAPTLQEARAYCRRLARGHYENFTVASWLVPRELRQPLLSIYAYCRWADDLADELDDPRRSGELLDWWGESLLACYEGQGEHPVFVALGETIRRFDIPREPFLDLLVAFRRDQVVRRYERFEELLDYCRYSANPVGRLVLCLAGCCDAERAKLADSVCTGLQLANFWQDVARDWRRGRVYLPQADCRRHGYDERMFASGTFNPAFRSLLEEQVLRAEGFLRGGWPLAARVPRWLQLEVALFVQGGLAVLEAIQRQQYDVWSRRPKVSRLRKLRLLVRSWWLRRRGALGGSAR